MNSTDRLTEKEGKRPSRTGPLRRMSATDASAIRETLAVAWHTLEPEERTQRQLFSALMPDLYVLRHKGFSFRQLSALLNDCGFALQPGTVRSYYKEFIDARSDECERRLDEQMLMLQEVQQMTRSVDAPKLASKIAAMRQRNQMLIEQRVNTVLAIPEENLEPDATPTAPRPGPEQPKAAATQHKQPPLVPDGEADDGGGSFGLLNNTGTKVAIKPGGGFFNMDDAAGEPQIPSMPPRAGEASTHPTQQEKTDAYPPITASSAGLRCALLKTEVQPLSKRPGVPAEVYEEGLLEHPAIPGLMLNKDQRLYGALLEILDSEGELFMETLDQKRFRIKWAKPVAAAGSEAGFVPLHPSTLPSTS